MQKPQEPGGGVFPGWHNARMSDYERIARLIRFIDVHRGEQPTLESLAREAGLSVFHFHRLFARWAGITPKDFLQCLTLSCARDALRRGASVLEAAYSAGLSGPGRLHDLALSLEAATPGEIKAGGAGWEITGGFSASPFGECLVAQSPRGICHLAFLDENRSRDAALDQLRESWPNARMFRDDAGASALAARIFNAENASAPKRGSRRPLRLLVRGSEFQVRVWRALLAIPEGALMSYGGLAQSMQIPSAARAVGSAVARNTIAYLIPCHRVIRETGVVGEYRWGHERKRVLLAWEGTRAIA